ncbi:MAG TPA: 4Fe-4S dicluster domain-containing protein [Tepidisphaeraceae bacterium]
MAAEDPINRRRFFRVGLRELLRPIASAASPLMDAVKQIGELDQPPQREPAPAGGGRLPLEVWLRPPGAIGEREFGETCSRCGDCAKVCPAQCIKLDAAIDGVGLPSIDANAMACVLCSSLACMSACQTGALIPTAMVDIDMGTAVWREETCVRGGGEACTICVDHCPLGGAAIELRGNAIAVNPLGCTGCGVCQHDCPTSPKSIYVIPKSARER